MKSLFLFCIVNVTIKPKSEAFVGTEMGDSYKQDTKLAFIVKVKVDPTK